MQQFVLAIYEPYLSAFVKRRLEVEDGTIAARKLMGEDGRSSACWAMRKTNIGCAVLFFRGKPNICSVGTR
jgi:hypothetical protein